MYLVGYVPQESHEVEKLWHGENISPIFVPIVIKSQRWRKLVPLKINQRKRGIDVLDVAMRLY